MTRNLPDGPGFPRTVSPATLRVDRAQGRQKLVQYLHRNTRVNYSLRQIKTMIERGGLSVNGADVRIASRLVQPGDTIRFDPHPLRLGLKIERWSPEILFEDELFLVICKEWGVSCEAASGRETSVLDRLLHLRKARPGSLNLLHRLDRDTSGVLVLYKQRKYRETLLRLFQEHRVIKEYQALVLGTPVPRQGHLKHTLGPVAKMGGNVIYGVVPPGRGKLAETRYEVRHSYPAGCLVRLFPVTGRTHQLRVQMAHIRHPVLGDPLYGPPRHPLRVPPRHMLHASRLEMPHPLTGGTLVVSCPLPADFEEWQSYLSAGRKRQADG